VETYRSAALDALGDPTRRSVFELLGSGGRSVGEIAARLPVSRPAVSQHLKVLHGAGLVVVRPEGTRRVYELDPTAVAALRDYFDRFWTTALAAYKQVAEATAPSGTAAAIADTPAEEQP
jgi:DNA-binding transcriptional ArsR family regulator